MYCQKETMNMHPHHLRYIALGVIIVIAIVIFLIMKSKKPQQPPV